MDAVGTKPKVVVVMPAYNAARTLRLTYADLPGDIVDTVILVDDGVATGATVIAAARWTKKQEPATLVIAVPVAPAQTIDALKHEADMVVALAAPRDFGAVGEFYEEFTPVTDEQVMSIMRARDML